MVTLTWDIALPPTQTLFQSLAAASLNFLGLGPTGVTSWGSLVSSGQGYINQEWWIAIFPGVLITLFVISVNLIADWLRDVTEPADR